jgi:hypothetical protein
MNNPNKLSLLLAGITSLAVQSVVAAEAPKFRAEGPVDRDANVAAAKPSVNFKVSDAISMRSAVAVSSAGAKDGMFIPTENAGSGNFEKRPYRFTLSLNHGYDDNIYTTNDDKQGSFFTSASVGVSLALSDGRTSLRAALNAGGSYYYDRDEEFDPDIALNVDFSHVFSSKLRLDITSYLAYQSEPDFAIGFAQNRRNGNYFYGNVGFNLTQAFTRRFSAVYGYNVAGVVYDEELIASIEDRIEQTFSLQLRYLVRPTVSLVGEYRFSVVSYDAANRDSTSNFALAGVDFTLNRRLTASFRAGAQFRDSDDAGKETSPFVESTLSYAYGSGSSIQWLNRYGFEESDLGEGSSRKTYRTGLTVNHRIASRVTANAGVYYTTSEYDSAFSNEEQTLDLNLGVVYAVNRVLSLQTGYTYTHLYSDEELREYDRNRVYAGVTLTF